MEQLLQLALFALLTAPAPPASQSVPPAVTAPAQDVPKATASANPDEADSLILPDGTAIVIKVVDGFSSENAKEGDVIKFAVAFDVREGGLVVIPQRTGFTGKVVFVSRPHRGLRSGRVTVAFDALTLPTGETATVRSIKKPSNKAAKAEEGATTAVGTAAELFITAGVPLLALFKKGDEQVVPEGTLEKVYINGPLRLGREAVTALQPTSASGYANVYVPFQSLKVFCGERDISKPLTYLRTGPPWFQVHLRLQLSPGSYWFSTDNPKERPVRTEILASREYSVGRNKHGLHVKELRAKDNKSLQRPETYPSIVLDKDLTKLTPEEYRSLTAEPAVRRSESGTQHE